MSEQIARKRVAPDHLEALDSELPHWPDVEWEFLHRNNHTVIELRFNNLVRRKGLSGTTVNTYGADRCVADVKRMLRDMGAKRDTDHPGVAKDLSGRPKEPYRPAPPAPKLVAEAPKLSREHMASEEAKRAADPFTPLADLQIGLTRVALDPWYGVEVNKDRLDEAAMILIAGWHPEIISRAAKLIHNATK